MSYDSVYPTSAPPHKLETDWAASCAEIILRRCPACEMDSIIGHGRRCELPRDQNLLDMAVLFPGDTIASDAMPWLSTRTGQETDPNAWPLPDDAFSHPRSAGTFTRFLAQYVRDRKLLSWLCAIANL
jgi:hypothetical protein